MARAPRSRKKKAVSVDFSEVGESFKPDQEYLIEVTAAELKDGQASPYFSLKLECPDDEMKGAVMYHNASTAPGALWRLKALLEAFGIELPDGAMELTVDDFIGKRCMCSTILDRYEGGSSIKPEEFWSAGDDDDDDGDEDDDGPDGDDEEIDLDDFEDDEIKAIAKKMGVKGRGVKALRTKLEEADTGEIIETATELGYLESDDDDDGDDDDGDEGELYTKAEVNKMNEEELEGIIEDNDLDVDLEDYKTLRKKKAAVIEALDEAELLDS